MKLNTNDTALPTKFQGGLNFTYPLTSGSGRYTDKSTQDLQMKQTLWQFFFPQ